MVKRLSWMPMAGMLAACLFVMTGCEPLESDSSGGGGGSSSASSSSSSGGLPDNPSLDGSSRQKWAFGYKEYDSSFRIRWPTYFATDLGVGPGSYCLVNGEVAVFRSFDTDDGGKKPSYTISGPITRFGEAGTGLTIVLYSAEGKALAWIKVTVQADGAGMITGRLP